MTIQEKVGKAIVLLRKQRGMAQEEFANESGIDRRYMSDIENGKRNISIDVLERVAKGLGLCISDIISVAESMAFEITLESVKQWLCDHDYSDSVVFESPDYVTAIIGVSDEGRVIYSYEKMVEYLVANDDMSYEDAYEFIDYNTIRAIPYMGNMAPIVMHEMDE